MGALVVDSSALLAILLMEEERLAFASCIENATSVLLSPVNYLEVSIAVDSRPGLAHKQQEWERLLKDQEIEIIAVDAQQAIDARKAYRRFGKGNHLAKLNMGDCFAYALAKKLDAPLLYKGSDFDKTDVKSAL